METTTIGFIGLGLIGGSIAKAIRKFHPEYQILAYNRTRDTLEDAVFDGIVDIALSLIHICPGILKLYAKA